MNRSEIGGTADIDTESDGKKNSGDTVELTEVQRKIKEECDELAAFLIEKNKSYGNSAFEPLRLFAKRVGPLAQIDVRIDDKLKRLQNGDEFPGDDTVLDLAGYLILRRVAQRMII